MLAAVTGTLVCYEAAKNLIFAAKVKMQNGEPVGGCIFFGGTDGYIDRHVRKENETLETAVRNAYRMLDGLGISEKFDGSAARAEIKRKAEEKAKRLQDKKDEKAAAARLAEKADKAKSLKDKKHIEILEAEIDRLKTAPQAEAVAQPPVPVKFTENNPVKVTAAMRDAVDLDEAVYLLQKIVFATPGGKLESAVKKAIKFLKRKSAFCEPSVPPPSMKSAEPEKFDEDDGDAFPAPVSPRAKRSARKAAAAGVSTSTEIL